MAINNMKCPSCGATLTNVDPKLKQFYCTYCGTQIINEDPNHYTIDINRTYHKTIDVNNTYHTIDEAKIREVDAEKEIKLKKLEFERTDEISKNKIKSNIKDMLIGIAFIAVVLFCFLLYGIKARSEGKISLKVHRKDLIGENYLVVKTIFEDLGFTNIRMIDLNDADTTLKNENVVSAISVGGDLDWTGNYYVSPDEPIIISYH